MVGTRSYRLAAPEGFGLPGAYSIHVEAHEYVPKQPVWTVDVSDSSPPIVLQLEPEQEFAAHYIPPEVRMTLAQLWRDYPEAHLRSMRQARATCPPPRPR